ncbi:hypothetical protein ES703_76698 [subsurface metagenome]
MLDRDDMIQIARARLHDADALVEARRYDGAIYLCGYAVEMALKTRICKTLHWSAYPETRGEFRGYQSFRTHDLDVLLRLSGVEEELRREHLSDWLTMAEWDPEARYKPIGSGSEADAKSMIESARILLEAL